MIFIFYQTIYTLYIIFYQIVYSTANIFNIIVLTDNVMSKTTINAILKWLAVTDMLVMIEYIPFSLYIYIFHECKLKKSFSAIQYLFDVLFIST